MAGFRYDDSPHRLDEFVTVEELDELIADQGKHLAKDHRRTEHFLQRTVLTLQALRTQMQKLHRDVQSAQIRSSTVGAPTTLDPRSAARFLPPEELAALADELIKEKFAAMKQAEAELAASRAEMVRRVQMLKFAIATVEEDQSIPAATRDLVTSILRMPLDELDAHLAAVGVHAPSPAPPADAQQFAATPQPVPPEPAVESGLDDLFD